MDPDQVVATGADHLSDTTTSAGGDRSDDSWASAVLRRGWDLSRKAAIAGAAATAAPVVAPPLIVLSIAGLALSVPFAANLASLAATNRLMGALLPSSPAQRDHTYDTDDNDVEQEFLDASEEYGQEFPVFDYWNETEEDTFKEENESVTSLPLSRNPGVSEVPVPASADEEGEVAAQESGQESFVSNSGDKTEEGTTKEENESTTKEALPRGFDFTESAVPLVFHNKDSVVQRMVEGEVAGRESDQESFVSNNGDKIEYATTMQENEYTNVSELPVPMLGEKDIVVQREVEGEVAVEMVVEEVISGTDVITREVTDVQVDVVAIHSSKSDAMLPSDIAACESQEVVETAHNGHTVGITVMEDIVREFSDAKIEGVEHHDQGVCSSVASVVSVHDVEDVISSGSTPYVSTIGDEMIVESRPDDHKSDQATGVGYRVMNEGFGRKVVAADEDHCTEEQLREQLDTIRTITGYRAVPSSTLEGELAGLYIFVGVEPPVSLRDTSDLMELNAKLRFLKSIIGVDYFCGYVLGCSAIYHTV